jgi:osmotically inducible protein OsmC
VDGITTSRLALSGRVPGIDEQTFLTLTGRAKDGCPVSKALAGVDISLSAQLAP